ncbi:LysR family transcriptional regulator [Rhizobium rhizogenes]|uniref:LysR family transcriptional regulator n=1 Tax=Rhizobium rhizogenes TaxID=359 RepID=UPI0015719A4C|nr:LysR family transcriptional regulator [Rhizobium rhizogenes]NTH22821.1 LysR family transcriptional regulator [Rhizobium rhizogenes]NTH35851.1 LysR family transcriptional regulator [Rhizobium rhizogenes]
MSNDIPVSEQRRRNTLVKRMSHFDFRNLAYLEAAVSSGSVRGGAEVLNTSPSALSRQIAKMEVELNVPLLERHGRGVRPTEAGTLFLKYFQEQRRQIETVVEGVWEILGLQRGAITVALGRGFGDSFMEVLKPFSATHPSVQINLAFGTTDEIVQKIVEGDAHIGLAYNPPKDPKLHSHSAKRHPMCAITRPGHPLTELGRKLLLTDLADFDLGLLPGKFGIRQTLLNAEDNEHVVLAPKLVANSDHVLQKFAREWNGVIVGPRFAIEEQIGSGQLVATEFSESYLQTGEAQLFTRRGRKLPPAAAALLQTVKASLDVIKG